MLHSETLYPKQKNKEQNKTTRKGGERLEQRGKGKRGEKVGVRGREERGSPGHHSWPFNNVPCYVPQPLQSCTQVLGGVYHPGFSWAALLEEVVKVSVLPPIPQLRALRPQDTPSCASAGHNIPSSVLFCLLPTLDTQVVYKTQTPVKKKKKPFLLG